MDGGASPVQVRVVRELLDGDDLIRLEVLRVERRLGGVRDILQMSFSQCLTTF